MPSAWYVAGVFKDCHLTLVNFLEGMIEAGRQSLIGRPATDSKEGRMSEAADKGHLDWLEAELADTLDEDYELELSEPALSEEIRKIYNRSHPPSIGRAEYFRALLTLQAELIKMHDWVSRKKEKVVVIFEGRDSAGKGGVIKRITQRLNPRVARVVALPAPSDREKTQWYFQRYVPHLPAGGEIVLFDRSWYNRAGVERVMGFATEEEVEEFFKDVPEFERMLVRSGIRLIKYWFSITDEEQQMRFLMRIHDPLKQWKLSPMDLQSRVRWEAYTRAKEEMFARTNIPEAPWFIVEGNDKKRARLNCIDHLLKQIPYEEVSHPDISLPQRVFDPHYERKVLPQELYVPHKY
jgi:polyphosphate kinase